jgi:subtilase family serine protease
MWQLVTLLAFGLFAGMADGRAAGEKSTATLQNTARVDLVQVQLLVPKRVRIGKTVRVMDEVENQGDSLALETVTGFYLSEDDQWDEKDILVGGRRVPQLGSRQSHNTVTPVTIKPAVTPGNYHFLALADARHRLEERYRGNNVRSVAIIVLPAESKDH